MKPEEAKKQYALFRERLRAKSNISADTLDRIESLSPEESNLFEAASSNLPGAVSAEILGALLRKLCDNNGEAAEIVVTACETAVEEQISAMLEAKKSPRCKIPDAVDFNKVRMALQGQYIDNWLVYMGLKR